MPAGRDRFLNCGLSRLELDRRVPALARDAPRRGDIVEGGASGVSVIDRSGTRITRVLVRRRPTPGATTRTPLSTGAGSFEEAGRRRS